MKIGDLVELASPVDHEQLQPGLVIAIDEDWYGARQAFKIYGDVERGKCLRPNMVNGIGPTQDGIRDRILVHWSQYGWAYEDSKDLEVIHEVV